MPPASAQPDIPPEPALTEPLPLTGTETAWVTLAKVAVTVAADAPSVTSQAPTPVQAPDQPGNSVCAAGVAVSLTVSPWLKLKPQVAPQLIPAGALVTVPEPFPALVT